MNYQIRYDNTALKNELKESLIYLYGNEKIDIEETFKTLEYGNYVIIDNDAIYSTELRQSLEAFNLNDFLNAVNLLRTKNKHIILKLNNVNEYYKLLKHFGEKNYIINSNLFNSKPYMTYLNAVIIDNQVNFILDNAYKLLFSKNERIDINQYLRKNKIKKLL